MVDILNIKLFKSNLQLGLLMHARIANACIRAPPKTPGMTMVIQVEVSAVLDKVKAGDKVCLKAEKFNGAIVVTDLQPSK